MPLYEATWNDPILPRTYLAVSTAPMNMEDAPHEPTTVEIKAGLKNDVQSVNSLDGIKAFANAIHDAPNPRLVLFFHGFNNSVEDVCHHHAEARKTFVSLTLVGNARSVDTGCFWAGGVRM